MKNRPSFKQEWPIFHLECVVEISLDKSTGLYFSGFRNVIYTAKRTIQVPNCILAASVAVICSAKTHNTITGLHFGGFRSSHIHRKTHNTRTGLHFSGFRLQRIHLRNAQYKYQLAFRRLPQQFYAPQKRIMQDSCYLICNYHCKRGYASRRLFA